MRASVLLTFDAVINLTLGLLLMAFPATLVEALGVPEAASFFYPNILGAVLFGIGIALWLGRRGSPNGLGLGGAVSINLCGGAMLGLWLLLGNLQIPIRGYMLLWFLVVLLVGLSAIEAFAHWRGHFRAGASH